MSAVLVVGGAGYIGSHVCKELARRGYLPVTYDSLVTGHREAVRWGPFAPGDLADRQRLDDILDHYRPATVMHFAAFTFVGESVVDPGKFYRNNVVASLVLLEAMREHGIRNLVFSSSCAVYGQPQQIPLVESHPRDPANPYGFTKYVVEQMLADFGQAHGLRSVALRYFNAAGADAEHEIGELHTPETHLIPLALAAAMGRGPPLTILGTDYPTPDGSGIRDYIHVTDLAVAHIRAMELLEHASGPGAFRAYNLGAGEGYSVWQVLNMIKEKTGLEVPIVMGSRRAGDVPRLIGDNTLARRDLNWEPQYSSLTNMVTTAWRWMQQCRCS
ncbi:MAG: UDP-glucose 4-epimerase GalE [Magnetococcus sp. DMHC-1]|nr:UDP-glucose 4-epimerase GalE [Magnetococcales bacterium]